MYTVRIMFFPVRDADHDGAATVLLKSFGQLITAIPVLRRFIATRPSASQEGTLAIVGPSQSPAQMFRTSNLTPWWALNYDNLRAQHFPFQVMKLKNFLPQLIPILPTLDLDAPAPILLMQLTFLTGGIALTVAMHHCFGDSQSLTSIIQLWAAFCRGETLIPYDKIPRWEPDWLPLVALFPDTSLAGARPFVRKPEGMLLTGSKPLRKEIFFISKKKTEALKAIVACRGSEDGCDETTPWVSTNDCLCALLWSSIIDVQRRLQKIPIHDQTSTFGLSCSFRHSIPSVDLSSNIGNFVLLVSTSKSVDTINTSQGSLQRTAADIRSSIKAFSHQDISNAIKSLEPQYAPDISKMIPIYNVCPNKVGLTVWTKEPYYDFSWGPLIGKCERVRPQVDGPPGSNGFCIVFPEVTTGGLQEEGLEIMVRLYADEMEALKKHEIWSSFAEWRG